MNRHRPRLKKPDRYKQASLRTYSRLGREQYDGQIWSKLFFGDWDRAIIAALGTTEKQAVLLDIGCGTGRLLARLAAAGFTHLCGCDLAQHMLNITAQRLEEAACKADLQWADVEDRLPWPDGSFRVVLLTGVFHHLFRPLDGLGEIRRVLGLGGRLLVVDPWFRPPLRQLVNLYLRLFDHGGDCRMYSPAGAAALLTSAGFTDVAARRLSWHSFLLTALKSTAA